MVKLSRFTRKTAATVALTLALIGGLSFNPANTLMSQAATTGTVTADQPENTSVTTEQPTKEKPQKKVVKDKKKYKKYIVHKVLI